MGYVYFIDGGNDRHVKVGFSGDPWSRLQAAKTWAPSRRLKMIDFFKAGRQEEQMLHEHLRNFAVQGEWFDCIGYAESVVEELDDFRHEEWLVQRAKKGLPFDERWPGLEQIDCSKAIRRLCFP